MRGLVRDAARLFFGAPEAGGGVAAETIWPGDSLREIPQTREESA